MCSILCTLGSLRCHLGLLEQKYMLELKAPKIWASGGFLLALSVKILLLVLSIR